MNELLLKQLRTRVAGLAIGASSLRNMTGSHGVEIARKFCADESLLKALANPKSSFADQLDRHTQMLASILPKRKTPRGDLWGPARKNINIFLQDATYNIYLRTAYNLGKIESLLEVPLDNYVARGLTRDARCLNLSCAYHWHGVVHVTPETNTAYQNLALEIARRLGLTARIQLDLRYWRGATPPEAACGF